MTQEPVSATLFAYQVGFGDCLLLRFGYADGSMRHMLFDFGTTSLPESAAKDHMLQVANDIAAKCCEGGGDRLDVLVATHRHADHISGFATRKGGTGSGDVIARLRPRVVVQPWTEAPEAPVDWKGPKGENGAKAFATHRAGLQAMHDTAAAALAFIDRAGGRMPAAVREQIAFIGEDNLSNLSAVKNLQAMGDRHEYVFHGCVLDLSDEVPGVVVDVLGPPTLEQTDSICKQRSRDRDEFWQLTAKRMGGPADATTPPSLFPDAPFKPANRMLTEYRWLQHRLDHANADLTLSLVRALDDQMNNTSVIMVMRVGGRTLLFPGDAQIENWAYALQSPLAALLDDVDLYKVGHHGSLNATPKSMWARFRKRSGGKEADKLTSVVSTKAGKHGSEKKSTEVPRRTLIAELEKESHLHSTERLRADALYQKIDIPLR